MRKDMTETQTQPRAVRRTAAKQMIIDCDIHNVMAPGALEPYLSNRWLRHLKTFGSRQHSDLITADGAYGNNGCYTVTGMQTSLVQVHTNDVLSDAIGSLAQNNCKNVSHVDFQTAQAPATPHL